MDGRRFPVIIALEVLLLPKWCQRFCPLGALLSLFSGLNRTFRPQMDAEKCLREGRGKACNLCEQACPEASTCTMSRRARPRSTIAASARVCRRVPRARHHVPVAAEEAGAGDAAAVDDEIPERG